MTDKRINAGYDLLTDLTEAELAQFDDEHLTERARAYLLAELSEAEAEQFEDECFDRPNWPAQLELIEEDLIDAYLSKELTPERRQRFEQNYATTEARQAHISTLARLACQVAPAKLTLLERFLEFWRSQTWGLRMVAAFAPVAVIAAVFWFPLAYAPGAPQTFATLALTINVNNNRADGVQAGRVKLPLNADALRISLTLPAAVPQAARYRVAIENAQGVSLPVEVAGRDAQSVSINIPAAQLARGQYAVKLLALRDDGTEQRIPGSYFFSVE